MKDSLSDLRLSEVPQVFKKKKNSNHSDPICQGHSHPSLATYGQFNGDVMPCSIKVIGVGGGGGNAVRRMFDTGVQGAEFWAINTDLQALGTFAGTGINTLHIGQEVTKGLGAGSIPENGRRAAEVSRADIMKIIDNADLVFITAGMGGGTGSGAAPIVAEISRKAGALTIGVVTKPFQFEGARRTGQAVDAIRTLKAEVDTLLTISNERLLRIVPANTPLPKAFAVAYDVLRQAVVGISELIIRPGLINVDFADVKTIMSNAGKVFFHLILHV